MIDNLLERLKVDYPDFCFRKGKKFAFHPPKTILVGPEESSDSLLLMHELGHAVSGHRDFRTDAGRLKMEREAWEAARNLCLKYDVDYDESVVERELDTYRDWLDQKSRCPSCGLTRFQTPDGEYHCPRCGEFKQPF
jgi:hypothetical protein